MKTKTMISGLILLILLAVSSIIIYEKPDSFDYSYTKAICEDNRCADYYVVCSEGEILELTQITGEVVFHKSWVDTRENKEITCLT